LPRNTARHFALVGFLGTSRRHRKPRRNAAPDPEGSPAGELGPDDLAEGVAEVGKTQLELAF